MVDEVLDSSLDEEGINMAMNLFRSFKDSNIFVISHRETIQDSRFDKIIKVKKERQFSVIEDEWEKGMSILTIPHPFVYNMA